VRLGVEHGGNKSGIPTVTGAVVHHPGFLGKPLVFCGTVGLMPRAPDAPRALLDKKICNNDYVVMIGGAIGKDGIHGATFSSLELSESSPVSAVQLGDPLTQRRVWDFLIEARDRKLFRAVTDNGAGGLSSSVGELATLCGERGGADIDVSLAKTKYAGLMAFELIVSESQERMSLAVAPESLDEFLDLAQRRGVVCSVLGQFKDDGYFRVRYQGQVVGELSMEFLHDGLPTMQLSARVTKPDETHKNRYGVWASLSPVVQKDVAKALLAILAHPNVCSRRSIVQRYDHEVQGRTVRKPYGTAQHAAPNDGAVIRLDAHSTEGVALGLGLRPDVAPYDAALAADLALDEAIRNVVAAGGDPEHTALVDNFCWPDPLPPRSSASATDVLDAEKRLGDLVVSCQRLYLGAVAHGMPFVSGKDSMKNDYRMGDVKISVPPTVLVTAMAKVPHVGRVPRGQIMAEHFAGQFSEQSTLKLLWVAATAPAVNEHGYPSVDLNRAPKFYRALSRLIAEGHVLVAHDVSEGGFLAATAEVMMGAPASVVIDLHKNPAKNHTENFTEQSLVISPFFEAPSAFVLVVTEKAAKSIEAALDAYWCQRVGEVTHQSQTDRRILKYSTGSECFQWAVTDLERAYHGVDDCGIQGALPAEPNQIDSNEFAPSQMIVSHHIAKAPHHGPRALILTGDGLNCHRETLQAAELAGFQGCIVHLNDFLRSAGETKKYLDSYPFLAIPGGFSFGDELGSGRVLALKLKNAMGNLFENYLKKGGLVLGICNGFQTLALMDVFGEGIRLGHNKGAASGFINRWVALKVVGQGPFFSKIKSHYKNGALNMELPIRHGEGRLVAADPKLIEALVQNAQVAAHYQEDINGSTQLIAGLTAYGGQVLGMMPHPEAYWSPELHPWGSNRNVPLGTVFFEGAYHALKS
jgi:phosphoribosylformylglycinamidine (FGAM) synthase-like enzyme/phosphoribosylformylglycinamidine (FGAM) synthase-like amidotransferase family enzyme